jgi:hypothetical protein
MFARGVVSTSDDRQDARMTTSGTTLLEPTDTAVDTDVSQLERAFAAPSFVPPHELDRAPLGARVYVTYVLFAMLIVGSLALVATAFRA